MIEELGSPPANLKKMQKSLTSTFKAVVDWNSGGGCAGGAAAVMTTIQLSKSKGKTFCPNSSFSPLFRAVFPIFVTSFVRAFH